MSYFKILSENPADYESTENHKNLFVIEGADLDDLISLNLSNGDQYLIPVELVTQISNSYDEDIELSQNSSHH